MLRCQLFNYLSTAERNLDRSQVASNTQRTCLGEARKRKDEGRERTFGLQAARRRGGEQHEARDGRPRWWEPNLGTK